MIDKPAFRQAVLAEPNTADSAVLAAAETDAENAAFLQQVQALETSVSDVAKVAVPDGLEAKLLAIPEMNTSAFQQAILADPNTTEGAVLQEAQNNADNTTFLTEVQALESDLQEAAKVSVPEGLEQKLLTIPGQNDSAFQQAVLAEPNSTDETLLAETESDPNKYAFKQQVEALEADIDNTARVAVPAGLEQMLLDIPEKAETESKVVAFKQPKKTNFLQLAMAASVAFALGLSFTMWQKQPNYDTGAQIALGHIHHEEGYAMRADGDIPIADVNAKLANFGGQLTGALGRITFANYCFFEKQKSLHLIMETDFGKVTMFITPKDLERPIDSSFGDDKYEGSSWRMQDADITIISEKQDNAKPLHLEMKRYMQFSA